MLNSFLILYILTLTSTASTAVADEVDAADPLSNSLMAPSCIDNLLPLTTVPSLLSKSTITLFPLILHVASRDYIDNFILKFLTAIIFLT